MPAIHNLLDFIHRFLVRHSTAVWLSALLRNQLNCIVKYYLMEGTNPENNGEAMILQFVAPQIKTFIDVGANVGQWTSLLLAYGHNYEKGLLFEPSDCALQALKQKLSHLDKIEIIQAAVSDEIGELPFFEESDSGETSSLVVGFSKSSATRKLIKTTTLDVEAEKSSIQCINFLKIDTEGYDLHVLYGAKNLLAHHKIEVIQFEYNEPWALAGSTLAGALKFLDSFGFKVFLLKSTGLFQLNYKLYKEYFSYSNYIALCPYTAVCVQIGDTKVVQKKVTNEAVFHRLARTSCQCD